MKKSQNRILIFVISFFIFNSTILIHNCSSQWQYVGPNTPIRSLEQCGSNILAAYGNIYLSSNSGQNWIQSSISSDNVTCLATSQFATFAGTGGNGIFKSTDNGFNWTQQLYLLNEPVLCMVAVYPWIYAGIGAGYNEGVLVSSNNGINWINTEIQNARIYALCSNGPLVYAGSYFQGVLFSNNHGSNWVHQSLQTWTISIAEDGYNIYAGTYSLGVYHSSNQGTNWSQTSLSNRRVNALINFSPAIFAGTDSNGVYLTTDNGQTWTQHNEGLGNATVNTFLLYGGYWIFAGTNTGVYRRPVHEMAGIKPISNSVPESFTLFQNYPNPFNPVTTIEFSLPLIKGARGMDNYSPGGEVGVFVRLSIFDITGREVATLVNESLSPGKYKVVFDASQSRGSIYRTITSGIYFYKLMVSGAEPAGDFISTKKMILLK